VELARAGRLRAWLRLDDAVRGDRSLDVTAEREAVRVADDGLDPDAP
jgi:hypothetical protein